MKRKHGKKIYHYTLFLASAACLLLYCCMAYRIPVDEVRISDEMVRQMIPFYIVQKGEIPTGFELDNAMDILMPEKIYRFYGILIGISLAFSLPYVFKKRDKSVFHMILMIPVVSSVLLSVYYSWAIDYQPQGRYLMPMLPVLSYFMFFGINRLDKLREDIFFQKKGKISPEGNVLSDELKKNPLCALVLAL